MKKEWFYSDCENLEAISVSFNFCGMNPWTHNIIIINRSLASKRTMQIKVVYCIAIFPVLYFKFKEAQ